MKADYLPLIALGLCGLFSIICLFMIAYKTGQLEGPTQTSQSKTVWANELMFEVGDCVQFQTERESWEEAAPIWKILEIGKSNYKTCLIEDSRPNHCEEVLRGNDTARSLSFASENNYRKVSCGGL